MTDEQILRLICDHTGKRINLPNFTLDELKDFACAVVAAQAAPDGWKLVPIEPTENMVIHGFESAPHPCFGNPDDWDAYEEMSGCQQAAHRAKLCWAAMLAAVPTV